MAENKTILELITALRDGEITDKEIGALELTSEMVLRTLADSRLVALCIAPASKQSRAEERPLPEADVIASYLLNALPDDERRAFEFQARGNPRALALLIEVRNALFANPEMSDSLADRRRLSQMVASPFDAGTVYFRITKDGLHLHSDWRNLEFARVQPEKSGGILASEIPVFLNKGPSIRRDRKGESLKATVHELRRAIQDISKRLSSATSWDEMGDIESEKLRAELDYAFRSILQLLRNMPDAGRPMVQGRRSRLYRRSSEEDLEFYSLHGDPPSESVEPAGGWSRSLGRSHDGYRVELIGGNVAQAGIKLYVHDFHGPEQAELTLVDPGKDFHPVAADYDGAFTIAVPSRETIVLLDLKTTLQFRLKPASA